MSQLTTQTIKQALSTNSEKFVDQLSALLPEHMDANRMSRIVVTAFNRNPKIMECDPNSVWQSILDCCSLGLEPDALGRAYFVPFKGKCQLQIGYKGLVDLAMRTGKVATFHSDKVYESDEFEYIQGSDFTLRHVPNFKVSDKGKPYCYYAYCKFKDGSFNAEVMTIEEINLIMCRSQSANSNYSPWKTDYDEMARKTVVKRLSKMLPLSAEFADAVNHDNQVNPIKEVEAEARPTFDISGATDEELDREGLEDA